MMCASNMLTIEHVMEDYFTVIYLNLTNEAKIFMLIRSGYFQFKS